MDLGMSMQGQLRLPNENLHGYRVTYVLCVNWDVDYDGDIHFQNRLEESSISGQIRSNKVTFSCSILSMSFLFFSFASDRGQPVHASRFLPW